MLLNKENKILSLQNKEIKFNLKKYELMLFILRYI